MRACDLVICERFDCADVEIGRYSVPEALLRPDDVAIVVVAEAPALDPADGLYAGDDAFFARTMVAAFRGAGEDVGSVDDLLELGVYLTTAVKCAKTGYGVSAETMRACSALLEVELGLFPLAQVLMLMGAVAVEAVNAIALRNGEPRVVPAGATHRLRGGNYRYRGLKVFPTYLESGPVTERNKQETIAEDVAAALAHVRASRSAV